MTSLHLVSDHLLLDPSSVFPLFGSGHVEEILRVAPATIAIVDLVREKELLYLLSEPDQHGNMAKVPFDIQPLLQEGIIVEEPLTDEDCYYVLPFSALNMENGEAETAAVAFARSWAICMDDREARRRILQIAPHLEIVSTAQIVKHWADTTHASHAQIQQVLQSMRVRGPYNPSWRDDLYDWCQLYF